ncbi:hypothetical protein UB45_06185 [Terrabacter sp. 28]|nr:hypothetical protein UB45_06185 [Terrabacter sp. 28]
MLHGVTDELPPPSGPPQPNPDVDSPVRAADSSHPVTAPIPVPPPLMPPPDGRTGRSGTPGAHVAPGQTDPPYGIPAAAPPETGDPFTARPRIPVPGSNGLAIAALCCGIFGFVPLAAVVAIVLGIVALNQLRDRIQRGKGMAIAGLALGVLWVLGWVAFIVAVATDAPARNASGAVTQSSDASVEDLKAGDCFSGAGRTEVDSVTIVPCTSPHESQVVTIFAMPSGPWPGEDKVVAAAEDGCSERADPLLTRQAFDDLRPSFIYPQDAFSWRGSREIICTVDAPKGTTTGSALR